MKHPYSSYSFLWSDKPPYTDPNAYGRDLMKKVVANVNVRSLLPQLYTHLQPKISVCVGDRQFLSGPSTTTSTPPTDDEEEDGDSNLQEIPSTGTETGVVVRPSGRGPLTEHRTGMPSELEAFIIDSVGLFRETAQVYEARREREVVQRDG